MTLTKTQKGVLWFVGLVVLFLVLDTVNKKRKKAEKAAQEVIEQESAVADKGNATTTDVKPSTTTESPGAVPTVMDNDQMSDFNQVIE